MRLALCATVALLAAACGSEERRSETRPAAKAAPVALAVEVERGPGVRCADAADAEGEAAPAEVETADALAVTGERCE